MLNSIVLKSGRFYAVDVLSVSLLTANHYQLVPEQALHDPEWLRRIHIEKVGDRWYDDPTILMIRQGKRWSPTSNCYDPRGWNSDIPEARPRILKSLWEIYGPQIVKKFAATRTSLPSVEGLDMRMILDRVYSRLLEYPDLAIDGEVGIQYSYPRVTNGRAVFVPDVVTLLEGLNAQQKGDNVLQRARFLDSVRMGRHMVQSAMSEAIIYASGYQSVLDQDELISYSTGNKYCSVVSFGTLHLRNEGVYNALHDRFSHVAALIFNDRRMNGKNGIETAYSVTLVNKYYGVHKTKLPKFEEKLLKRLGYGKHAIVMQGACVVVDGLNTAINLVTDWTRYHTAK